jgi:hypothetical protein
VLWIILDDLNDFEAHELHSSVTLLRLGHLFITRR